MINHDIQPAPQGDADLPAGDPLPLPTEAFIDSDVVQAYVGFQVGLGLGATPGGAVAAQLATSAGLIDKGTKTARIARSVGEMIGGGALAFGGGVGDIAGGAATATGPGAVVGLPVIVASTALVVAGAGNAAVGVHGLAEALMSKGSGQFPNDKATKATENTSGKYGSEREARAMVREKLGKDPVEIEPGKMRSQDGRWQYRAKPEDLTGHSPSDGPHIHLERLNPETGEVLYNLHLRW